MLLKAHSRQKMSPCGQETGVRAGSKQSRHDANGKNDSLDKRAEVEFQADFARFLS
jgi:hypothetical protein